MEADKAPIESNTHQISTPSSQKADWQCQQLLDALVTNEGAAEILATTPNTLKVSRHTGYLYGRPAPPFLKLGSRRIAYRRSTLINWINQFQERPNTSAIPLGEE